MPSPFTLPTLFLNEKIKTLPHYSAPLLSAAASPAEGTRKERALPFPTRRLSLGSASPALFSIKTSIFLKSGDIMQQQRGGAQASLDYVPERGRCNQSSHLKVASPLLTRQQKFIFPGYVRDLKKWEKGQLAAT
ncbi:uncharacterized protein [Kogia breviceps]|uniref:uncharacterized protein isoform X2 n=1 Tax=Kogia breviceps TaxID=27615 RepID=UPI0034D1D3DD